MAVNTFVKDSQDPNPLIRALAVRTMGCIRVDKITEYLCDPLHRCLKVGGEGGLGGQQGPVGTGLGGHFQEAAGMEWHNVMPPLYWSAAHPAHQRNALARLACHHRL